MNSVTEQNKAFSEAMDNWLLHKDKKSLDTIWVRVYEACKADAKRLLKVSLDDGVFHDRLMDAVMTVMRYIIEDGKVPKSIITFCYLPTLAAFCGPKAIKEDKEYSYEFSVDNGYDLPINILGEQIYD